MTSDGVAGKKKLSQALSTPGAKIQCQEHENMVSLFWEAVENMFSFYFLFNIITQALFCCC